MPEPPSDLLYAHAPWLRYRQPLVRDLCWCIFSAPLVADSHAPPQRSADAAELAWLDTLERDPTPLQAWLTGVSSPRLGFLFERFWQFWWLQRQPQRQHRFNLQIQDRGRTLGELDAVSWSPEEQRLEHTELAVKFYLGVASEQLPQDRQADASVSWVGPNVRDRLDLKLQQMRAVQLQQLQNPAALAALPSHWHWRQLTTRLLTRGRLFYPWDQRQLAGPADSDSGHERGFWLPLQRVADALDVKTGERRWLLLERAQWLSPIDLESGSAAAQSLLLTATGLRDRLQQHFHSYRQPRQIASLERCGPHWRECERGFVVPDQWPRTT